MPTYLSPYRLCFLLALITALTGTWWGIGTALLVLGVVAGHALLAGRGLGRVSGSPAGRGFRHLGTVATPTK
jgi:hypothetical protein